MTEQERASRIADRVFAFVQDISQDRRTLETLVGLAGERGYEINVSALGRFLEVSSGLTPAELTDAQLDAVAGGLTEGSLVFKMLDTISDSATDDCSAMNSLLAAYASTVQAAKDATIGAKQSKMASDVTAESGDIQRAPQALSSS